MVADKYNRKWFVSNEGKMTTFARGSTISPTIPTSTAITGT
ncbi:MAG: hypothetical protein ABIG28_01325 [archaeon]